MAAVAGHSTSLGSHAFPRTASDPTLPQEGRTSADLHAPLAYAIVAGADACGLGVIRSLGQRGVPIIVMDTDPARPGMRSRYARRVVAKALSGPRFIESLLEVRGQLGHCPVLFLLSDAQVRTVSESFSQVANAFQIRLPSQKRVSQLLHKSGFQQMAEEQGFSVPGAVAVRGEADFAGLGSMRFPAVVKPGMKEAFLSGKAPRARRVRSREEAEAVCRAVLPIVPDLIVQEWVEGAESDIYFCLQYRGEGGKTISSFTGRKLRCWPPLTGSTASCVAAPEVEAHLSRVTDEFFLENKVVGMCSMEFKRDRVSGRFFMIEPTIGRVDWQEEVATLNGRNIPLAAYCHELGLPFSEAAGAASSVIWRDPPCYWRSVFATRNFSVEASTATRVVSTSWRADDPRPTLFFWYEWFRKAWRPQS